MCHSYRAWILRNYVAKDRALLKSLCLLNQLDEALFSGVSEIAEITLVHVASLGLVA